MSRALWGLVAGFVLLQVALVASHHTTQFSDASTYIAYAKRSIELGSFYPSTVDLYTEYIFAPGYVNYLAFLFKYLGISVRGVLYANVVLNVALLAMTWQLAARLFDRRVAAVSVVLFCLYLTHFGVVLFTLSDLLFAVLAYGGLCLVFSPRLLPLIAAGVLLALANWVRPVALVFIIASLALIYLRHRSWVRMMPLLAGLALTVIVIGVSARERMGHFNVASTTSGLLVLMGANDDMTGGYEPIVFEPGKIGHIEGKARLTFAERDAFYKAQALHWIREHPLKYLAYVPIKLIRLYAMDYFYIGELSGVYDFKTLPGQSALTKVFFFATNLVNQAYYMGLLAAAVFACCNAALRGRHSTWLLATIVLLGSALTIMGIAAPRYHFPYMVAIIILAAAGLCQLSGAQRWLQSVLRRGTPQATAP